MLREAQFWINLLDLVVVIIGRVYRLKEFYFTAAVYFGSILSLFHVALDMLLRRLLELL